MHGIGGVAGADDDLAGFDFETPAAVHERGGIMFGSENLREPVAQRGLFLFEVLMQRDNGVFAALQRVIQFRHDADFVGNEFAGPQRLLGYGRQMHQYQPDTSIMGCTLDLRETVGRR